MPHYRCPTCGQGRPQNAFDLAGNHLLQVIHLTGRGQGRGFARSTEPADRDALVMLLDSLDRARAQVIRELQAIELAVQQVASTYSTGRDAYATTVGNEHSSSAQSAGPTTSLSCPRCSAMMVLYTDGLWRCQQCGLTM